MKTAFFWHFFFFVIYEWFIRERNFGVFEGQTYSEFSVAKNEYGEDFAPENSESIGDIRNRARDFIKSIPEQLEWVLYPGSKIKSFI